MGESPESLARRVVAREPAGVARAISLVEDRRPSSEQAVIELLATVIRSGSAASCARVGITGPPGVGKSTLVSEIARALRAGAKTVGVLAVDPSSPRSGGALLGDRARIQVDPEDEGMFVRSMASGGDLGGLARAAGAAVDVLSSAYDVVLVETTGVGQSETDVEHVADTVALVVQPGSGDVLQFLKAGILEIPDLFIVNKADLGGIADRAHGDLEAALATLEAATGRAGTPVLRTTSKDGGGVAELVAELVKRHEDLLASGQLLPRRIEKAVRWSTKLFVTRNGERGVARVGHSDLERALRGWARSGVSPVEAVRRAERELLDPPIR